MVFVEVERPRVTSLLAGILETLTPPKIVEAATTLCELQVEIYGSTRKLFPNESLNTFFYPPHRVLLTTEHPSNCKVFHMNQNV